MYNNDLWMKAAKEKLSAELHVWQVRKVKQGINTDPEVYSGIRHIQDVMHDVDEVFTARSNIARGYQGEYNRRIIADIKAKLRTEASPYIQLFETAPELDNQPSIAEAEPIIIRDGRFEMSRARLEEAKARGGFRAAGIWFAWNDLAFIVETEHGMIVTPKGGL